MKIDVLTLFPEMFKSYLGESILKRAQQNKHITIKLHNIRDFSKDKHKKTDDTPYGGGAGMLMTPQPLYDAIKFVKRTNKGPVIYMSPKGPKLTHTRAKRYASSTQAFILLCGRYEGIDERIRELLIDEELSIGDYVLTGGELPAMVFIDAVSRGTTRFGFSGRRFVFAKVRWKKRISTLYKTC
jgi:tRNA (guanine37-N1)-methyltransferase